MFARVVAGNCVVSTTQKFRNRDQCFAALDIHARKTKEFFSVTEKSFRKFVWRYSVVHFLQNCFCWDTLRMYFVFPFSAVFCRYKICFRRKVFPRGVCSLVFQFAQCVCVGVWVFRESMN